MAKDKERLFKDIDEKNITFQRAVFIVCNLKRLIKRPKKDDKHSSTGSARKRSGANAANEDESNEGFEPTGYAAGPSGAFGRQSGSSRARLRFRDPVRRAFTLPAMLCSTFAVNSPAPQAGQVLRQLQVPSTTNQKVIQDPSLGDKNRANEYLDGNVDGDDTDSRDDNSRMTASAAAANWFTRPPRLPPVAGLSPPRSTAVEAENSPSLSYLVTPIRRPNNSLLHHHLRPPAAGPSAVAAVVAAAAPTQVADFIGSVAIGSPRRQQRQQQICCPVWALAMHRLDALQGQPRDHHRHAHLVGPPSSLSFLLAPRQPAASAAVRSAPVTRQSGCGELSRRNVTTSSCSSSSAASSSCSSAGASRSSSFSGSSSCSRPSCNRSEQEHGNNGDEEDGQDNYSYDERAGDDTRGSRGKKGPPIPPPPAKYRRSSGGHETSAGQQQQQQQHLLGLRSRHAERPAAGTLETSATSFSTQAR